jgi:hypothetical protein|tara:strand:+ start:282 stop:1580 length:1299 start_codon:yes stop_codon:yes gene_type:complete
MTERFNIKQWFLISLLLRLIVMPFTVHGDMFHIYNVPHFFSHGEWNAYEIAVEKYITYYPPFAMIFFAFVQLIFRLLFHDFEEFTHTLGFLGEKALYESEHLYLSLFLMKLPYLVFDCLLILTCWKMLPGCKRKHDFMVFWAVNPIVIYSAYMFGQFDIIPSFFVILSCYFSLQKGKGHYACLSLAAGCLFKLFPIVFLPVVLLISSRNMKDFVRLSFYGIIPILFFYGIFYLVSGEAVFKLLSIVSDISRAKFSFDMKLLIFRICQAVIYFLICFHAFFYREKLNYTLLIQYFLAVCIALLWEVNLPATHYFIWIIPLIILYIQEHPEWKKPLYFLMLIIFLAGLKPRTGTLGIFAPINPELFLSFPSLKDVTGFLFDQKTYDIIIGLLFKGITGIWALVILKNLYYTSNKPVAAIREVFKRNNPLQQKKI